MKTFVIKISLIFFSLLMVIHHLHSQPHGNEWINYDQKYFRIKISETGVYRIGYTALNNAFIQAGLDLTTVPPAWFKLYAKGEQVHVYVKGENEPDNIFDADDYIEFYAEKNDGWFDAGFYNDSSRIQPNPNYSLISDTAVYFLTWASQGQNRLELETDVNFSGYTASPYCFYESRADYTTKYYYGETYGDVTQPEYSSEEGWFDNPITTGNSKTKNVSTHNRYSSAINAEIEFLITTQSSPAHHLRIEFLGEVIDTIFSDFQALRYNRNVASNLLNDGNTSFLFSSIDDINSYSDRSAISYINIKYPRSFQFNNMSSFRMFVPDNTQDKSYLVMSDINIDDGDTPLLYDLSNNRRVDVVKEGDNFKALVPNSGNEKECYLTSESQIQYISNIEPVNNNTAQFADFLNNFYDKDYFILSHKTLMSEAISYQDFRNSTGYNAIAIDAGQLYDQYSYGIRKHPLAFKNFMRFALDNMDNSPKHLFLLGKGYTAHQYRKNTGRWENTYIPAFGYPPSDLLFTSEIGNNTFQPAVSTGRLAARNPEHVELYLNKITEYEMTQQNTEEWMKYILHFGGGGNENEQNTFASYLRNYENTIEDTLFGGIVETYLKTSTQPIQINQSDSLKNMINNGVSMMTFFGHASGGSGFDQSIDDIDEYDNQGKYPFLLANSCWAGDLFSTGITTSEEFVLIENKGMIGFLASVTGAFPSPLNIYSNEFYKQITYKNYGKPVGECIKETVNTFANDPELQDNFHVKITSQMMTLHGDPAVKINSHQYPDYLTKVEDIFYSPANITTEVDSFIVNIAITNIGKALGGSFSVKTERIFPDGTSQTYLDEIKAVRYKDTLQVKMPVNREIGVGLNQVIVDIDNANQYEEISEVNNHVQANFFITSADVIPVYPYRYSIMPDPNITLKCSSGDPFGTKKDYILQLDTTDYFNSPLLIQEKITGGQGVINWNPPVSFIPGKVYYWRVRIDSSFSNNPIWRQSSFQYIPGKEGWGQSHFYQFANNNYKYVNHNRELRKFEFVNSILSLTAQTGYNISPSDVWYMINSSIEAYHVCIIGTSYNGSMTFAVFEPISKEPWESPRPGNIPGVGIYGNYHCRNRSSNKIEFPTSDDVWLNRMENFLDSIPAGHQVLVMSYKNVNTQNYSEGLFQQFEKLGSQNIRNIENGDVFLLFGEKKDNPHPGTAHEIIGSDPGIAYELNDSMVTNWDEGFMESTLIGPSKQWEAVKWKTASYDDVDVDSVRLNIIGLNNAGERDTLLTGISTDSSEFSISNINANTYPYLKLAVNMRDDSLNTPANFKYWEVFYEGVAETALDPALGFYFHKDTLQEGDEVKFSTAIHNISKYDMDSLLIDYWIIDKDRVEHKINYPRQAKLPQGDVFIDTISYSTKGLSGMNTLWIEVNPDNDQLEQTRFNNIGQVFFEVERDNANPLLDVTFDGVHILDGDIVSAKPQIQIALKDENKFLELNDTSLFRVYIKHPSEETAKEIPFYNQGKEVMRFYPSASGKNSCKIEYDAQFPEDGVYELLVQARDASGNESGDTDYRISFEVINKSTITKVMNWPNPFSTRTHFVFTLTGSKIPDRFLIQIMTVTGKVVREITMDELGPIHIGRNITQYAWDGKDDFGDKLANGVYLYRVITKINSEKIEKRPSGADKYFKKNFGKMYLMR